MKDKHGVSGTDIESYRGEARGSDSPDPSPTMRDS